MIWTNKFSQIFFKGDHNISKLGYDMTELSIISLKHIEDFRVLVPSSYSSCCQKEVYGNCRLHPTGNTTLRTPNARLSAFYKKIQELLVYLVDRKEIQIVIFSNIYFVSNDRIRHKVSTSAWKRQPQRYNSAFIGVLGQGGKFNQAHQRSQKIIYCNLFLRCWWVPRYSASVGIKSASSQDRDKVKIDKIFGCPFQGTYGRVIYYRLQKGEKYKIEPQPEECKKIMCRDYGDGAHLHSLRILQQSAYSGCTSR